MTKLTDKIYAVEVPEETKGFETDNPLSAGDLVYYMGLPSVFNFRKISLPPGSYRFLFTTKTATEEDARKAVAWFEIAGKIGYYDYTNPEPYRYLEKWEDSLAALLRSKNLDPNKNYALIEKHSSNGTEQ